MFFPGKITNSAQEAENSVSLKQLKLKTSNLKLRWGTYESFFVQILGAIGHVVRVSEPKTETPIGGLHGSSSKTNRTRRTKVSN